MLLSRCLHFLHDVVLSFLLPIFSRVVPSPESFFRRILGLASIRGQTTSVGTFIHLSVIFSTVRLSLMFSFLTWYLSVWPHAHLHIFISVTSSFFTWELVTGTVFHPVQHSWNLSVVAYIRIVRTSTIVSSPSRKTLHN